MTIRDLGYRPYEGERLSPANNSYVLLRYGLKRAWSSWLVKIAAFVGWVPPFLAIAWVGIAFWIARQAPPEAGIQDIDGARVLRSLLGWQLWLFVSTVTIGAGASAISEDMNLRAFQFYFAKPVTPVQYLFGRIGAVVVWCFSLTFAPTFLVVLALVGTAPEAARLERLGLLFPAFLCSALIALTCSVGAVAASSLSRSRALTMSAWILLFIVPYALGNLVLGITQSPWLLLGSLPALLGVVEDALFKIDSESKLHWYHALPLLIAFIVGAAALAFTRLRKAEVIA